METGVSSSELQGWPIVPPTGSTCADDITFTHTNTDTPECAQGWRRHSREAGPWDMSRKPILSGSPTCAAMLGQAG